MAGGKGSALEWALALLRAPGERHALRQRDLPGGMDVLLSVAGETNVGVLSRLAAEWEEPAERLQEAARFYAREVLFHPQADAYRVLGLTQAATSESIRTHHRLLQRWLHPDRRQAADDSVFAVRVNKAWDHLRSPGRREAYDQARASQLVSDGIDASDVIRGVPDWRVMVPVAAAPVARWRRRAPVYMLLLACIVLAGLGVRDATTRPDLRAWQPEADTSEGGILPRLGLPPAGNDPAPAAGPAPAPKRTVRAGPHRVQASPRIASAATSIDENGEDRLAFRVSSAPASSSPAPGNVPLRSPIAAVQARTDLSDSAPTASTSLRPPTSRPSTTPGGAPTVRAAMPVESPRGMDAEPPARVAPAGGDDHVGFERVQDAREAGEQLLRYMASPGRSAPPIWNSPGIQSSADRLRQDLHRNGRQRLGEAKWRIGRQTAALVVNTGSATDRHLTADMVWREGRWLVTGVNVEPRQ